MSQNFSLRKANALQVAINEAIKNLDTNTSVSLNEFQEVSSVLDTAYTSFADAVARRAGLLDVLYEIRKSVDTVNANNKINDVLADMARLEKDIQFYSSFAKSDERIDLKVLQGRLEKIATRKEDAFGYGSRADEVQTSVLRSEDIESYRNVVATLKRQKQKLQDDLLELNQ